MCATSSSYSVSRPDERRRNSRLRATSLIYAQLGSDNGGVVVNLGLDGTSCHAAHKLIANQNSTITLKLRGSGLNIEIAGEVIWIGATQKDVGISFKSVSAEVQRNIADWIARESAPSEMAVPPPGPPKKTLPELADAAVPDRRTITRSLSAALALSRAMSANLESTAPRTISKPDSSPPADQANVILPPPPAPEIFPTSEHARSAADPMLDEPKNELFEPSPLDDARPPNVAQFPEKEHAPGIP